MRRIYTLFAFILLFLNTLTVNAQSYSYPIERQQGFTLNESSKDGMHISYELGHFALSQVSYRGEEMSEIAIKGIILPNNEGCPNIPVESRMLAIPQGATATLNVVRADQQVIKNVNIAPALRIQPENEEPVMDYKKDPKIYSKNAFYPEHPFEISKAYMRGVNVAVVSISPFQYNPVTKDLIVYTNVELSISYEGGTRHFGDDRLRSPYWDPILAAELINYDQLPAIDYEARMQQWLRDGAEGAEYLIITPNNDAWAPYAEQLKQYRTRQGILTKVYRLDEMPADNTTAMKEWFHNAYHTWAIAPVAVCLLGDHNTDMTRGIPAIVTEHTYNPTCITDNFYADAEGGDNLPDMVFSRLVAGNADELPVFVGKQIEYEYTHPNMEPSFYTSPVTALGWQTKRWFQICSEVVGGYFRLHNYTPNRINCIYEGEPGNIWSENDNTPMVTDYFGPNGLGYIPETPEELGDWNNGSANMVVDAVNAGSFWIQHRDHGLTTGWGEPAVRNEHIELMNNVGKMPFVMSINCQTGQFDYTSGNCFSEAWMRRTYNGENAGAVGVLSPTEVSYSFVNDVYVWGVYDLFDGNFLPDFGPYQPAAPATGNWLPAFGNVAGKYFLAQSAWPYNTEDKDITYTMFTAHCDAFLKIYTQVPEEMPVAHQPVQVDESHIFPITAPEGATIALTKGDDDNIEIVAVATATGSLQNVEIPAQSPPTVLRLTVVGQNYLRYEADIEVIPADGPYVVISDYALADETTQLHYGDDAGFDIVLKNLGNTTAPAGTATLTTESEYVTITNGTVDFDAIESNNTSSLNNAFAFTISDEVPDKTSIYFTVTIASGDDTYEGRITTKAFAPVFKIGNRRISEIEGNDNGRPDPGEIMNFEFDISNIGNADSREADATLVINNDYLHILDSDVKTIDGLSVNGSTTVQYQIYVGGAPAGFYADYTIEVVSGAYTDTKDFFTVLGPNVEDFEKDELDPSLWTNNSAVPWTITDEESYEGKCSLRSGQITNSSSTEVTLTYTVTSADTLSFYYKVSSENNYDKLFFYIDGVEQANWSGTVNWSFIKYPIGIGSHEFTWKYEKDYSISSGSDCAWIDFVTMPRDLTLKAGAGIDLNICENDDAHLLGYAVNYQSVLWTTAGDGSFDDPTIAEAIYTPGAQDRENGSVELTMTATGNNGDSTTDAMIVNIHERASLEPAIGGVHYCAIQEPQTVAVQVTQGQYTSFIWNTMGSGEFANPHDMTTTYTPSADDIAAGSVTLLPTITTEGCGRISYEYVIEWNAMPEMVLETTSVDLCENEPAIMNFTLNGIEGTGTVVINGVGHEVDAGTTSIDLGSLTAGTTVFNITEIRQDTESPGYGCTTVYGEGEMTFTAQVSTMPEISFDEMPERICQDETLTVAANVTGDYGNFEWNTTGDGVFGDPTALETTYTPGIQDIGSEVILTATANSAVCGVVTREHFLIVNPIPVMDMPVPNCTIMACQGQDYPLELANFSGYVDGQLTIEVNGETIAMAEGQPLMLPTANLEPGFHNFEFHHLSNGLCESDPNTGISLQIIEAPDLTISNTAYEICEGETVTVAFTATGGDPDSPNYTIIGEGIEPITFTGTNHTLELTPAETTEIRLTQISTELSGCGEACDKTLDITLKIEVLPFDAIPEISGDTVLDVRITPVSTYAVTNNVMVGYALEPAEAGTIIPANDGKSVEISWSETFKGHALLVATPQSTCNNGNGSMSINVKNTTGVDEFTTNAKIFPNPSSGQVNIECEGMVNVSVYNALGQMVYNEKVDADQLSIDLSNSPSGNYLVRIVTNQGTVVKKLLISD